MSKNISKKEQEKLDKLLSGNKLAPAIKEIESEIRHYNIEEKCLTDLYLEEIQPYINYAECLQDCLDITQKDDYLYRVIVESIKECDSLEAVCCYLEESLKETRDHFERQKKTRLNHGLKWTHDFSTLDIVIKKISCIVE